MTTTSNLTLFQADVQQHTLAKYLMELSLLDYEMVHYPPSKIAAAAFCLSTKVLNEGEWVSNGGGLRPCLQVDGNLTMRASSNRNYFPVS